MGFGDFLNGALDSLTGTGSSGSGGTRDAFEQYQKYIGDINPVIQRYISQINADGLNPYANQLTDSFNGISGAISNAASGANRVRGLAAALPGQLRNSALASTSGAQQAAVNAARVASAGRGGLAFGGGAGAIAARAAQGAATQQGAALAQAMSGATQLQIGAEQAATGIQQNAVQQQLGLAGALSQARAQQAGLEEARRGRVDALMMADLQGRQGLAGSALYAGLIGNSQRQGRKSQLLSGLLFGGGG